MPLFFTIALAKTLSGLSRFFGRGGGSALPGLVAEKIDPGIGHKLARNLKHGSIIVTGTNGKTTTAKMIAKILADSGESLVANRAGSNLSRGVVSALIEHADLFGNIKANKGLFEVDEAAMPAVATMLQPRAILVLNLFRDQLDRYGELDTTAELIGKGIKATNAEVYLNADDPLVASLRRYANEDRVRFFGLADVPIPKLAHDVTADSNNCPICGRALEYKKSFFGHIGHYRCDQGHFERPNPEYSARKLELRPDGVSFAAFAEEELFKIPLPGVYNVYNALAASVVADGQGISVSQTVQSLASASAAFGRVEKVQVRGRTLYLLLVKNPTGFNQIIQTFLLQNKQQNLLILINDNFADGRDVSWLWDVAFEDLKSQEHSISLGGIRATDMALRLKYADLDSKSTTPKIKKALNQFVAQLPKDTVAYVVPTYTAMLEVRRKLGTGHALKGI